jgi:2-polyprenyl-3-methyl-5-hydroxy-6-metoxy-1,4-benzoquinol methylase
MSIFTGKDGYNSAVSWAERSDVDRLRRTGKYEYETALYDGPDPAIAWVRGKLATLPPNPDILEVGSGFGGWAIKLAGLYATFTGAEVMPERVAHARAIRKGPGISFHQIDGPAWNLGRLFPVVMTITVIQHLPVPLAIDVLKAVDRHLAPGGTALLAEGRIYDCTIAEAEALYAQVDCAPHMIPKPLRLLQEAVPTLSWEREGGIRHILRKGK